MNIRAIVLPVLAAGATAWILAPSPAEGFTTNGSSLGLAQRDFRIFDNFTDPQANNNATPHANFPGYTGAVMAIWKGCIEWQSELHGSGSGDPVSGNQLGSGGANFDPSFQGEAIGVGTSNQNILSEISGNGGSTFAFAELPSSDGWRIRYFQDPWTWQDGPGSQGDDLQGIGTHEYGHSIGLGHSANGSATMFASAVNGVAERSIHADDIAGIQAIYGVKDAAKPRITGVSVNAGVLTITGTNFSDSGNTIWFTQVGSGGTGTPVKVGTINSSGSGTQIVVGAPAGAGPGDVLVQKNATGNSALSNAWPVDPGGPPMGGIQVNSLNPTSLTVVGVDGYPTVSLFGSGFADVTGITVDGTPLLNFPPDFSILSGTQIDIINWPNSGIGTATIVVNGTTGSDSIDMTVLPNDPPALQLVGSTSEGGFLFTSTGLDITMGSDVADAHFLFFSGSLLPSPLPGFFDFGIGNNFTNLFGLGNYAMPADGYVRLQLPVSGSTLAGVTVHFQTAVVDISTAVVFPMVMSNIQSGQFLF